MAVYQKGSDWYIDYRAGGRRKRQKIGPSKKLAETVLRKRKVEAAENKHLDIRRDQKIKFKDFAHTYLENHAKVNKRSWRTSDFNYLKSLGPFFGEKYLYEMVILLILYFLPNIQTHPAKYCYFFSDYHFSLFYYHVGI